MSSQHNKPLLKLEAFLPYKLAVLSNQVSSNFAQIYKDKFALSITEWRIMAILGEYPGTSADEVSSRTKIEKSIISRSVAKLLQRHFIAREFAQQDKRRSILHLTELGRSVYEDVVPTSYELEEQLKACFSEEECHTFNQLIDKLYQHSQK
ncbi:MarR family winged helix-turn-helix transcriptional regulator [Paraferrimonas sp. SM1919]|uniref:MarR family winged helix-turn-helix transcriptional regulator n=1 Tax=Paraferrimonas sp. SM1919 TaxID=2662263 RepID=UPI0013D1A16A|nr:MarR family transcriptional regulator [Paraferrimonas sp. SM1919]